MYLLGVEVCNVPQNTDLKNAVIYNVKLLKLLRKKETLICF